MTGALKVTVPISELLLVVGHLSKCSSELKYELLHLSLPLAVLVAVVATAGCSTPAARPQAVLECDYKALKRNAPSGGPALTAVAYGSVKDIPADAVLMSLPPLAKWV